MELETIRIEEQTAIGTFVRECDMVIGKNGEILSKAYDTYYI